MLESVFRLIFTVLFALFCWLVFIPIGFVLATPVIFVIVLCKRKGTFKENMMAEYKLLWKFWNELGILMVPPW
jgi:hypothetical protein